MCLSFSLSLSNTCICCIVVCAMDMFRWSIFVWLCRICDFAATVKPPKSPKPHLCYFAVNHFMRVRPNGPWRKDSKTGRPRAENVMMLGLRLGWALQRCRNGEDAVADTQPHAGKLRQLALWCKRLEPKSPLVDTWMSRSSDCHSTKIIAQTIKNLGLLHSRWTTTAWRWQWQCLGASSRWIIDIFFSDSGN